MFFINVDVIVVMNGVSAPDSSTTTSMPWSRSSFAGPMPLSLSTCGVCVAPAAITTSPPGFTEAARQHGEGLTQGDTGLSRAV